jgi:hypothetical protein
MGVVLTLSLLVVSAPAPAEGPPPRIEMVQLDNAGRPYFLVTTTENVTISNGTFIQENGMQRFVMVNQVIPVEKTISFYLDSDEVKVFTRDRRKLEPGEVSNLFTKSAKVLVSTDGKPIDPKHVKRLQDGVALVVAPSLVKTEKKAE